MIKPNDHIRQVINNEQESKMAGLTACTKTSKTKLVKIKIKLCKLLKVKPTARVHFLKFL